MRRRVELAGRLRDLSNSPLPEPAPPGPDLAALAHLALTGIPDFAAVVSAVTLAWQAAREQRLHLTRGGARKSGTGPAGPTRLSLDDHVLATCYRQHLGMPCRLIGEILGVHESSISLATGRIAPLLTQQGITIHPAARIRTLDDLLGCASCSALELTAPSPCSTRLRTLQAERRSASRPQPRKT